MIGQPDYFEKVVIYWIKQIIYPQEWEHFLSPITLQLLEPLSQPSGSKVGIMGFPSNS
jgi:hypothetical protein